ncbi:MAG: lipopolysaccharide biosynthesis protein [Oscillospiraceae bacterium]|nr:lipopolysaccharide biosynthesis protein [Oscillospiraceae bacterium]
MNDEMNQKHYLNVTLESEKDKQNSEIVISFSAILKQLKRFLVIWIVISVIVGVLTPICYGVFNSKEQKKLSALISFTYSGIENGKAPDGRTFDVNTVKNPTVIENALLAMGEDMTELEAIRQGIYIEGVVPDDTIDKITMYQTIYEQGSLTAGKEMLDVKVYPTRFIVYFDYSETAFDGQRAVELMNNILTCYSDYFFEKYGFNEALGSAVNALDYKEYDYSQAVDVFDSTLSTLQDYVSTLSSKDNSRFRATSTGYTFSDLSESIATIRDVDLDVISSYITVNTVTKDKDTLLAYYNYRVENLNRQKKISEDELKTVKEAIEQYEKDTIIIYGEKQDTSQYTQASEEYDSLIDRKISAQKAVSSYTQKIDKYEKRISELNGTAVASKAKMEKVEKELDDLNAKINSLLEMVNQTADEYYETIYLANAYNILVPANTSALITLKSILKSAIPICLVLEGLIFIFYVGIAFVKALVAENESKTANVISDIPVVKENTDSVVPETPAETPVQETAPETSEKK